MYLDIKHLILIKKMQKHIIKPLPEFLKDKRKEANFTQAEFAMRAGVALTVIRKIEQGKENLNLEKVNHVLSMFGHTLAPVRTKELGTKKNNEHA